MSSRSHDLVLHVHGAQEQLVVMHLTIMERRGGFLEFGLPWGVFLLLLATAMSSAAGEREDLNARGGGRVEHGAKQGTIAFASVGRTHYGFDVFGVKIAPDFWLKNSSSGVHSATSGGLEEIRLTDGVSINYNGQLVEGDARLAVLEHLRSQGVNVADESSVLIFASERDGSTRIYFNIFSEEIQTIRESQVIRKPTFGGHPGQREILETEFSKAGSVVLDAGLLSDGPVLFDKPSVVGDNIVFVSTKEAHLRPRESWAAVYSTDIKTQKTTRLTPQGNADFSPSVSPSGEWVAVASSESAVHVETQELVSNLYVYKANDASNRILVVKHAGWPSWADDHALFFHRQVDDGWWSVFRVTLPEGFLSTGVGLVQEERITPPGVHALTPAASPEGTWVAVATRRPGSQFRHVEIFDLISNSFIKLTERISPQKNHYNPFVSSYSRFVGYHRCRGNAGRASIVPLVQEVRSPFPDLALVRIDAIFPSFSPDGSLLAFVRNFEDSTGELTDEKSGIYVSNANGSGQRQVFSGLAFSPAWDRKRKGVLYASSGPVFRFSNPVQIISVHNVDGGGDVYWKQLTKAGNNAFPTPSPDGKYLVFRSIRSGHKNLYIMDALEGEEKEITRLTEGPWTDQHPNWSPSGEWIAFTSDRENPGAGGFAIYLIHPDGTGLHKVLHSDRSGLTVHPMFSPDGKKLVFVSDLAGGSAEPVSQPHVFDPTGEIFIANVDGSNIERLTQNFIEDGTPAWSPTFLSSSDLSAEGQPLNCNNVEDTRWLNTQLHHSFQELPYSRCPIV